MNNFSLSKYLSLILRHQPQKLGIELDRRGWADLDELVRLMQARGMNVSVERVIQVAEQDAKRRYRLDLEARRIRANQGHSIELEWDFDEREPPELLYHGTAEKNLASIRERGLLRMNRHHVHLSPNEETALKVGRRHGKPVVLVVAAGRMAAAGTKFYLSENGVWLTDEVPPEYINGI